MESAPQGKGDEASSVLPSATDAGGSSGSGGGAGRFECSLGLDEQVKSIEKSLHSIISRLSMYVKEFDIKSEKLFHRAMEPFSRYDEEIGEEEREWLKAVVERLRMDPRVDVQILVTKTRPAGALRRFGLIEGATALHLAVMASDVRMVQKILEPGFEVEIDGRMSAAFKALQLAVMAENIDFTALHLAVMGGNMDILNALEIASADPKLLASHERTILHLAVEGGHEEAVNWVLARWSSLVNAGDYLAMTPLHWAVCQARVSGGSMELGVVKSLCKCPDTDMKALDWFGRSAFYIAVASGNAKVVIEFLESGKDRIRLNEVCDEELGPPIRIACERGHKDIEIALMECESVYRYLQTLHIDRQVNVGSINAVLVGAALIASVTFASWLQPPLNYTAYLGEAYSSAVLSPAALNLNYVDVEHNVGLRVFWVCNALAFYLAMATIVCGAATVLPRTRIFVQVGVEKLARGLLWTFTLLAFSVIFVIIAFATAGSIVMTPLLKYQWYMIGPTIARGGGVYHHVSVFVQNCVRM